MNYNISIFVPDILRNKLKYCNHKIDTYNKISFIIVIKIILHIFFYWKLTNAQYQIIQYCYIIISEELKRTFIKTVRNIQIINFSNINYNIE